MTNVYFKTSDKKLSTALLNPVDPASAIAKVPGTVYFTKDGKILYDLDSLTRISMCDHVSVADNALALEGFESDDFVFAVRKVAGVADSGSTDNAIVRFNGDDGQVQNSGVLIDDLNNVTNVNTLTISNAFESPHLLFSNNRGFNYIVAPQGGSLAFSVNGSTGAANIIAAIDSVGIHPEGLNETKDLGKTNQRWNNLYSKNAYISNLYIPEDEDLKISSGLSTLDSLHLKTDLNADGTVAANTLEGNLNRQFLTPISVKSYTNIATSSNVNEHLTRDFYFLSLRPTDWNESWKAIFTIKSWVSNSNVYELSEITLYGQKSLVTSYTIVNNKLSEVSPFTSYTFFPLTNDGYNEEDNLGHAFGVSLLDIENTITNPRNLEIQIFELQNCECEFTNATQLWTDWSSGYNDYCYVNGLDNPQLFDTEHNGLYEQGNTLYESSLINNNYLVGYEGIYDSKLFTQAADGTWQSIGIMISNAVARNEAAFTLGAQIYYYLNKEIPYVYESENIPQGNYVYDQYEKVDLRNILALSNPLENGKPIYLVGTINGANEYILDEETWWSQDLPVHVDGKLYIYLGAIFDSYYINLQPNHPIYFYIDDAIRLYNNYSLFANKANQLMDTVDVGADNTPVYFESGVVKESSYDLHTLLRANDDENSPLQDLTYIEANKLTVDAGNAKRPVYFSGGIPVACDETLNANINGQAATAVRLASDVPIITNLNSTTALAFNGGVLNTLNIGITGILPTTYGGTGNNGIDFEQGGIIFAETAARLSSTECGNPGDVLVSNGINTPYWESPSNLGLLDVDHAAQAAKLDNKQLIRIFGDANGMAEFDGSEDANINLTLDTQVIVDILEENVQPLIDNLYNSFPDIFDELYKSESFDSFNLPTANESKKYYLICQNDSSKKFYKTNNTKGTKNSNGLYLDGATGVLFGAAWNDYAEYRQPKEQTVDIPYGHVVIENGDDTLSLSTKRLQPGANVVSDTFGFAIGQSDSALYPIAVSGRVLVYTYEDRNSYNPGDAVCSAPNGTISKMTREEIINYPDRILGYVSAIPNYETWGESNIKVNNRIWIKVI